MSTLYLADAPTYASHIAAYPENGAAILALPAGTRRYIENMQCEVRRSTDGKYWIPDHMPSGHVFNGTNAHWIGPHGVFTIVSSTGHSQKLVRSTYWRMPGFRQASVSRISLYQTASGSVGTGSDSCALRVYAANPNGSPLEGAAPLFVWDFNAAGSGGASALTLANVANDSTRVHADLPGGPYTLPPHFWLAFAHDFQATAPNLSSIYSSSVSSDVFPVALNGTDVVNSLSPTRSTCYTWTEPGAWAIGTATAWPAGSEIATATNPCVVPFLKVVG